MDGPDARFVLLERFHHFFSPHRAGGADDDAAAAASSSSSSSSLSSSSLAPASGAPPPRHAEFAARCPFPNSTLSAWMNGYWRLPWRRERHPWEAAVEYWAQIADPERQRRVFAEYARCGEACLGPFSYDAE